MLPPLPRRRTAALAAEALVVTYPLVLMHLARDQLTRTASAGGSMARINEFAHIPESTSAPFASVITPNVDTLMSSAWLDLSREPLVLAVPDTAGRYYAMPLYDAWTTGVTTIGARTTGTQQGEFALVGPRWRGSLPQQLAVVHVPTSMAWMLGHIRCDGEADTPAVRELQAAIRLTRLSGRGTAQVPEPRPVDAGAAQTRPMVASSPVARLARMEPAEYFGVVARLLADNPPQGADRAGIERMSALGIGAGRPPAWTSKDRPLLREITRGMAEGLGQLEAAGAALASSPAPWVCPQQVSRRWDPLDRAAAAWTGLGAWPPQDGLFLTTRVDGKGWPLTGTQRYLLRFGSGELPPARAFWSLTAHEDGSLVVQPRRCRPALGDRDPLRRDPDGSLALLLQPDPPDGDAANWLQTPRGDFSLALRLYWPRAEALDGRWRPPPVERATDPATPRRVGAAGSSPLNPPGWRPARP